MKVGLVGCGNISAELCAALERGGIAAEIVAVSDVIEAQAVALVNKFKLNAKLGTVDATVSAADFVVEAAAPGAVKPVIEAAIRHHRDCLIMSIGGLVAEPDLLARTQDAGIQVRLPSGALCGVDGVRAAREAGLDRVTLTTRKPPKGLAGAPYIVERGIDLDALTEPTVVFEGTARDAIKGFPKNVNVAVALSLAGIGIDRTTVRVIAEPGSNVNSHEVVAEGAFGRLRTLTENVPSPANPKTSYLASLSACAELRAAALAFSK
ncbi:MAG: aspartate dehydrogenase [Candidatus Hydrogenedentes bacterium]|nr:aspartate dehydrogenase [Candidatus Hydrogenedentota bacterium]